MTAVRHPMLRHHSPAYRALLRYSRALHTYVSMLALICFTFFASTGFMLNHPGWFGQDNTHNSESTVTIPAQRLASKDKLALVEFLRTHGVTGAVQSFDWPDEGEPFHISFKAPGSQCDADITLPGGETQLNIQTRGLTGLITRLHTSKDAGPVWRLLVDATAILLLLVCCSGFVLWQSLPKRRAIGSVAILVSLITVLVVYRFCVP